MIIVAEIMLLRYGSGCDIIGTECVTKRVDWNMDCLEQIIPEHTICFTGHRPGRLPREAGEQVRMMDSLTREIETAVQRRRINFVSGAMSGFDTLAAEQVLRLKEKHPSIRCILVAPFSENYFNRGNWTADWEARLLAVIRQADLAVSLSRYSYKGVYYARDRAIVDLAAEVIAYYDGGPGGTRYTIDYARSKNKPITNIAEHLQEGAKAVTMMLSYKKLSVLRKISLHHWSFCAIWKISNIQAA
jgi:uncharacterized phage-like protein YoqJ